MPKDTKPPYFPFYPNDFSSDSKVEAMSTKEVGAYILLLCKAWWESPPGSIPNDDRALARWTRLTPDDWSECKPGVLSAFELRSDNRLYQSRLVREYRKLKERQAARERAGEIGAKARWGNSLDGKRIANAWQTHGKANAVAIAKDSISSSSSSSSSFSDVRARKKYTTKKEEKEESHMPPAEALSFAFFLRDSIQQNFPNARVPSEAQLKSWAGHIDKLHRIDKQPWEVIESVLKWSQENSFWQRNILSGGKFRDKWTMLVAQMEGQNADGRRNYPGSASKAAEETRGVGDRDSGEDKWAREALRDAEVRRARGLPE